jgi:hypothetical protein
MKGIGVYFCIRDDDTSYFTEPEELEAVYGEVSKWGPVSLAVVPFCRAGPSKAVPERYRGKWSIHPLHENRLLVEYLRERTSNGRFEVMLHGYYHDEPHIHWEFRQGDNLSRRVSDGRKYLEDVLSTSVRVFVPPRNSIGRQGLRAIARAGLHLGGIAGFRSGWSPLSVKAWKVWLRVRRWNRCSGLGIPWVLDLGDHHEIAGNAVTPVARVQRNEVVFESAIATGGVFCVATHYWELCVPSVHPGEPTVGEHLRRLIERARSDSRVRWRSVGDIVSDDALVS